MSTRVGIVGSAGTAAVALLLALNHGTDVTADNETAASGELNESSAKMNDTAAADLDEYVYKQNFMPRETVEIDLATTAMFVTDPQNDFLSEKSPAWGLVGPTVIKNKVVEKEKRLSGTFSGSRMPAL